ncbi:hypothetical protein RJZ57_005044 [Blastomyces gilchristii]
MVQERNIYICSIPTSESKDLTSGKENVTDSICASVNLNRHHEFWIGSYDTFGQWDRELDPVSPEAVASLARVQISRFFQTLQSSLLPLQPSMKPTAVVATVLVAVFGGFYA